MNKGWKEIYTDICKGTMRQFNTPKVDNLNKCYKRYLGIRKISSAWSIEDDEIEKFVKVRGEIAHHGSKARYIIIGQLDYFIREIKKCAIENDNAVLDYLRTVQADGRPPWYRITI